MRCCTMPITSCRSHHIIKLVLFLFQTMTSSSTGAKNFASPASNRLPQEHHKQESDQRIPYRSNLKHCHLHHRNPLPVCVDLKNLFGSRALDLPTSIFLFRPISSIRFLIPQCEGHTIFEFRSSTILAGRIVSISPKSKIDSKDIGCYRH